MKILVVGSTAQLLTDWIPNAVKSGHSLALVGRDETRLKALAGTLAPLCVKSDQNIIVLPVDSSSESAVSAAVGRLKKQWQTIDSMIVAIGEVGGDGQKFLPASSPASISVAGLRAGMEANLWSPLHWLIHGAAWMQEMPHICRICVFGSSSEHEHLSIVMSYPAGKCALTSMASTIAIGLAEIREQKGLPPVLVNFLVPGWFITKMNAAAMVPLRREAVLSRTLEARFGDPKDLTPAITLLTELATFQNLSTIKVDGGVGGFSGIHLTRQN